MVESDVSSDQTKPAKKNRSPGLQSLRSIQLEGKIVSVASHDVGGINSRQSPLSEKIYENISMQLIIKNFNTT